MAYFGNADDVYETLGQLLEDATASAGLGPLLQQTNTCVQLALSEPAATITIALSEGRDALVAFGSTDLSPALTLEMSADTAHEIFSGQVKFFEAASDGRLTQRGTSTSFMAAWPAAEFALPGRYAQLLAAAGRADLADVEARPSASGYDQDLGLLMERLGSAA